MIITTNSAALLSKQTNGDRRIWFRLVTLEIDSEGTVTVPMGVRLERFRQRPVFCWMHPLSTADGEAPPAPPPPEAVIGKVVEIDQQPEYLDILVEFAPPDANPQAETCYRLVLGGFLGAVSWCGPELRREDREIAGQVVPHIVEVELWEASLVIVGSNPGAQVMERALRALGAQERAAKPPRTSAGRTPKPSKRSSSIVDKDTLHVKLGLPGDVEHDAKAATRALTRYLASTTDSPEDRAKVCSAVEAHYPEDREAFAGKETPEEEAEEAKAKEGEGKEKGAEEAEAKGADDIDGMDEETAKAALRMARRAAAAAPATTTVGAVDAKVLKEVDALIADGQVPQGADERDRAIKLHARGKLLQAIRAAGIKPGTFTTSQRLAGGRVGTPVDEADQARLATRSARALSDVDKDAKGVLDRMHNYNASAIARATRN